VTQFRIIDRALAAAELAELEPSMPRIASEPAGEPALRMLLLCARVRGR
jgi:hypothetical protein